MATAIGCAPSQWNVLLFAKKLLKDAINAINNAKANSFDENAKIVDYSLRKVSIFVKYTFYFIFVPWLL